jgi:hypothetical protein
VEFCPGSVLNVFVILYEIARRTEVSKRKRMKTQIAASGEIPSSLKFLVPGFVFAFTKKGTEISDPDRMK